MVEYVIFTYIEEIFGNSGTCKDNDEINKYKHKLDQFAGIIFGVAIGDLLEPKSSNTNELFKIIDYMTGNRWKIKSNVIMC